MKTLAMLAGLSLLFAAAGRMAHAQGEGGPRQFMDLRDDGGEGGEMARQKQEIDRLSAVIKASPNDATAWFNRAVAHEKTFSEDEDEKRRNALADYTEAIRLKPDYAEALGKRAELYYQMSENEKALADFSALIKINPKNAETYDRRGGIYRMLNDNDKALVDFNEAIRLDPKLASAYYNRGIVYMQAGERDKAIADFSSAMECKKSGDEFYGTSDYRAKLYIENGDWDKAIADYSGMIRQNADPEEPYGAYCGRARAYHGKGDDAKAMADYTAAIKLEGPNNRDYDIAYDGRGDIYAAMGKMDAAIADYTKAVELSPNGDDLLTLGFAHYTAGKFDKTIADCTEAIETCDGGAQAYDLRGAAHAARGETKKAAADFRSAVQTGIEACQSRNWKDYDDIDDLAVAEARLGKFEQAVIHQQMAVDLARAKHETPKVMKALEDRLALYQQKKPWLEEKVKKRESRTETYEIED